MQKLQLFAVKTAKQLEIGLVRAPNHIGLLSKPNWKSVYLLSQPLPSTKAYSELVYWQKRLQGNLRPFWSLVLTSRAKHINPDPLQHNQQEIRENLAIIKKVLQGLLLSEKELVGTMRQRGMWPSDVYKALDLGVYEGELLQYPGFRVGPWDSLICSRCESGQQIEQPCSDCGSLECLTCSRCLNFTTSRSCSILLTAKTARRLQTANPVKLQLTFELTKPQKQAADQLLQFAAGGKQKALVWAACGAGKTEVTFPLIQQALSEGKRVLFAIPRQDIVREMATRLKKAFPEEVIAIHHGGRPKIAPGHLVVATTHQVLHFYQRFELIVLDEVDAFPYQGNELLRLALRRSLHPTGKLVEMTATPARTGSYDRVITIPARYHGYPLPEPTLIIQKLPQWSELTPSDLPEDCRTLVQECKPWLVFAPTIAACEQIKLVWEQILGKEVGICHSREPRRAETIERFRTGELDLVVTTSILERGVNFPGVNTLVLYSHHQIFNLSTLVQIAGRVGRSQRNPTGHVLFIGETLTPAMRKARKAIQTLNQDALERGLLHEV